VAELTTTVTCCAPEAQARCCEPSERADCCRQGDRCTCQAGRDSEREHARTSPDRLSQPDSLLQLYAHLASAD
jgi:hypothetical protein